MALDLRYIPAFYLQETLVDKDTGEPLAGGIITFYKDQARTELKKVFQITGSPPNYNYIELPNPLTLSSVGTIQNASGDDVVLYFYPFDTDGNTELYYYEVKNAALTLQFTREGQPNAGDEELTTIDDDNFILNAQFRLFPKTPVTYDTASAFDIAYLWRFQKSNTTATDKASLVSFPSDVDVEGTPTYYIRHECTSSGTGESFKDYIYRINDVNTFQKETIRFSLVAKEVSGSDISILFYQNFGTGGSPENQKTMDTFTLTSVFTKYTTNAFLVDSIDGKTIGDGSYVEIRIRMPLNSVCDVGFTNAQLNIGSSELEFKSLDYNRNVAGTMGALLPVPNDQDQYSKIYWDGEKFVLDPETGKLEKWILQTPPPGRLDAYGQTVVRTDKITGSTVLYDRLYQKWESDLGNGNAFGYGSDGFYPALYTNNAIFDVLGSGTVTDWQDSGAAPTGFTFTKIQDSGTLGFTTSETLKEVLVVTNASNGSVTDATKGTTQFTVTILQQGDGSNPEITQINAVPASEMAGGQYFLISSTITNYYVWFQIDGVGVDPAVGGRTGILVGLDPLDSFEQVTSKISEVMNDNAEFKTAIEAHPIVEITNTANGVVTAPSAGTTPFIVTLKQAGTVSLPSIVDVEFEDASLLSGGEYWEISSTTANYYFWYKVDGVGTDPAVGGRTGILVELQSTDNANLVGVRTIHALNGKERTKVTTNAASTLSGGEWFEAYNVGNAFYVWYNIDEGSTDPAPASKIGIEVKILSSDTNAQVAQKTSKAISSYYYVIINLRGYFDRAWNNGTGVDPDANERLDRGDGTVGDFIGTIQKSQTGPHDHLVGFGNNAGFNSTHIGGKDGAISYVGYEASQFNTGSESRPINKSVLYTVRF